MGKMGGGGGWKNSVEIRFQNFGTTRNCQCFLRNQVPFKNWLHVFCSCFVAGGVQVEEMII